MTEGAGESRPPRICTTSNFDRKKGGSIISEALSASTAPIAGSPPSPSFNPRRFIRLVLITGILAAVASLFGKLSLDFNHRSAVQILSNQLANGILPSDALEHNSISNNANSNRSSSGRLRIGSVVLEATPEGFSSLLQNIWKALLLLTGGLNSSSSSPPPLSGINSSRNTDQAAAATAALCLYCLVLLIRGCLFGCMLACNACMLHSHVKCLVAAPSAGSSSVSIFAANFLCSVFLSWILLKERLTLQFGIGAACMLAGVAVLSQKRTAPSSTP
ncbi:hypothetical protein ACSSS7_008237 [Eimeria intestinalis]